MAHQMTIQAQAVVSLNRSRNQWTLALKTPTMTVATHQHF